MDDNIVSQWIKLCHSSELLVDKATRRTVSSLHHPRLSPLPQRLDTFTDTGSTSHSGRYRCTGWHKQWDQSIRYRHTDPSAVQHR